MQRCLTNLVSSCCSWLHTTFPWWKNTALSTMGNSSSRRETRHCALRNDDVSRPRNWMARKMSWMQAAAGFIVCTNLEKKEPTAALKPSRSPPSLDSSWSKGPMKNLDEGKT